MSQDQDSKWRAVITLPDPNNCLEHVWPDPVGGKNETEAAVFARRRLEESYRRNRLPLELRGYPVEKLSLRVEAW